MAASIARLPWVLPATILWDHFDWQAYAETPVLKNCLSHFVRILFFWVDYCRAAIAQCLDRRDVKWLIYPLSSINDHITLMPARPAFSDLPLNKEEPLFSAWGLWGKNDELGTLNFLTEEVVRSAASEIEEGIRINLNWTFGEPSRPCFGRQRCEHKVLNSFRFVLT